LCLLMGAGQGHTLLPEVSATVLAKPEPIHGAEQG
jgi:hypothetical protein